MAHRDDHRRGHVARRALAVAVALLSAGAALAATPAASARVVAPATATAAAGASTIEDRHPATTPVPSDPAAPLALATERSLEPFSLVGLSLPAAAEPAQVRVHRADGWGPWQELHFSEDHDPDAVEGAATGAAHSEPIWVGPADGYELLLPRSAGAPTVHLGRDEPTVSAAIAPGELALAGSPGVIGRGAWGARPSTQTPVEASDLRVAFVHHSVTTNSYGPADVPGILRGIQSYHMDTNQWSDIGYNFAVDRFGQIWEARAGGVARAIVGGHAAGFNTTSVGVVMLGDFTSADPPAAMTNAVAEIIAWRFAVAGTDPRTPVAFTTSTGSTKWPAGSTVVLDRVSGHRDVGLTACPGGLAYGQLDAIRARVHARYLAYAGSVPTRWLTSPTHRYTDLRGESISETDITATAVGRLTVAVRGLDDALYTSQWDGSAWRAWERVAGTLVHGPAVVGTGDGGLEAFVVGVDGALYTARRTGGSWGPWSSLGGMVTAQPDAVRMADGNVIVTARGVDGSVWGRTRTPLGAWSGWWTLGGGTPAGSTIAVAASGARLDVLLHGLDGRLWLRSNTGPLGTWAAWQPVGGVLTDGPAAAGGAGGDTTDVVVRGGDGRLYAIRRTAGQWGQFTRVTNEAVANGPSLASWGTDRLDLSATTPWGFVEQTAWTSRSGW